MLWNIPSQLYFLIKGLVFVILSGCFSISSWFNSTAIVYWRHLLSFLLMGFIVFFVVVVFFSQSRESIYDPQRLKFIL